MYQCPLCHQLNSSSMICQECYGIIKSLVKNQNYCIHCGKEIVAGNICGFCQSHSVVLDKFWASYYYKPPISTLIQEWKFHSRIQYSQILSYLMTQNEPPWIKEQAIDCIIAMPLTIDSYQKRLFNQSLELALYISKKYRIPLWNNSYINKHNLKPQHNLSQKERIENIKKSFKVTKTPDVSTILIIDDVATTLATVTELAKSLKQKDSYRVLVWVLAH